MIQGHLSRLDSLCVVANPWNSLRTVLRAPSIVATFR